MDFLQRFGKSENPISGTETQRGASGRTISGPSAFDLGSGILLEKVDLVVSTDKVIPHSLGKEPEAVVSVFQSDVGSFSVVSVTATTVTLNADAAMTVRLYLA